MQRAAGLRTLCAVLRHTSFLPAWEDVLVYARSAMRGRPLCEAEAERTTDSRHVPAAIRRVIGVCPPTDHQTATLQVSMRHHYRVVCSFLCALLRCAIGCLCCHFFAGNALFVFFPYLWSGSGSVLTRQLSWCATRVHLSSAHAGASAGGVTYRILGPATCAYAHVGAYAGL